MDFEPEGASLAAGRIAANMVAHAVGPIGRAARATLEVDAFVVAERQSKLVGS